MCLYVWVTTAQAHLKAPLLSNPQNIDRYKRISLLQQNINYKGKRFVAFIPAFFLGMSQILPLSGEALFKGEGSVRLASFY